ncbi:MAG: class I SAM-dependent methyltransferase, partial [Candidatus Bathyarchaeota archaeon]|nr:class I SAM-dependent methyltransferase [Candidatus Bathyarchaeota archaeon]
MKQGRMTKEQFKAIFERFEKRARATLRRGKRRSLTRYSMYRRIRECLGEPMSGKILGISGIEGFYSFINRKNAEVIEVQYPHADMQNLPFKDDTFDFVISDQVIEHIHDPKRAICESYRVLKKGGMAIHTTCFMNYFHPSPIDFWRFSPDALRHICNVCGFSEILQCEGWGNRIVNLLCFISDIFRSMKIPETRWSARHL